MLERLHALNINQYETSGMVLCNKIKEESKEVVEEINKLCCDSNLDNLASELLDVLQVVKGITYIYNIDLNDYVDKHNQKMISRGYVFID